MTEPTPQATAVHEAGHAVMAYLRGRPFTKISVVADGATVGSVRHSPPRGDWFRPNLEVNARVRNYIEARIMICLAGAETEAAWYRRQADAPEDWRDQVSTGASHDMDAAKEFGFPVCDGDTGELEAYLEWLRMRVLNYTGRPLTDSEKESGYEQMVQDRITGGDPTFWALVDALVAALADTPVLSWRNARGVLYDAEIAWLEQA